jgi:hypothetical protein
MMINKGLLKQAILIVLFFLGGSIFADEVSKMNIIDDQTNQISVEGFEFERLDSYDATTIKIETKRATKVSCSIFDKNNRPVTTIEESIKPPITELKALSKNVMVTSVRCLEVEQAIVQPEAVLMEMYFKMPTFLLDNI